MRCGGDSIHVHRETREKGYGSPEQACSPPLVTSLVFYFPAIQKPNQIKANPTKQGQTYLPKGKSTLIQIWKTSDLSEQTGIGYGY